MTLLGRVASAVDDYNAFVAREVARARNDAAFAAELKARWKSLEASIETVRSPTGTPLPRVALPLDDEPGAVAEYLLGQGLPGVLWIALVFGGVVTIGFAMIFGLRSTALHVLMTGSLAAVIGALLFVAVAIDRPFTGDVAVTPEPLERVLIDYGGR